MITIIGLGPGSPDYLTLGAVKRLKEHKNIILRTERHEIVPWLKEQGINYTSLDFMYDTAEDFDELYRKMARYILDNSANSSSLLIGVPGHPLAGDRFVLSLIKEAGSDYHIEIIPGISRADELTALVKDVDPSGLQIFTASEAVNARFDTTRPVVIMDLDNPIMASELKLVLLDAYPDNHRVYISRHIDGQAQSEDILLYKLDMNREFDHTSCLYLPALSLIDNTSFDFYHLVDIMSMLRSPNGCPWDREQSHESLKQSLIEETYEVLEAINLNDMDKLLEELGDVLLQVVFHAQIAKEHGEFDIRHVTTGICRKMIDRHTHIFGTEKADTADEVVSNWEANKKKEKGFVSHTQVLRDIPSILPALMRSYKVQKKAALVGFDWDKVDDAILKVDEELKELKDAYSENNKEEIEAELGDLLFAVVNVARFFRVEPELALTATIEKFINRFEYIEKNAKIPLEDMTLEEMDALWVEAKQKNQKNVDISRV